MAVLWGIDAKGSSVNLLNTCADNMYVLKSSVEMRAEKQNPLTRYKLDFESDNNKPYIHTIRVPLPSADAIVSVRPIDNIGSVGILRLYRTVNWELYLVSSLVASDWTTGSNAIARSRIRVKTYVRNITNSPSGNYGVAFYNSGTVITSDSEFLFPIMVSDSPSLSAAAENSSEYAAVFGVQDAVVQQFGNNRPYSVITATNGVKWQGGKVLPTLMGFGANWYGNASLSWGYFNITEDKNATWGNSKTAYNVASGWHNAIMADAVKRGTIMLVRA